MILGLILILLVYLPLIIIDKYLYSKRIDRIIESYKGKDMKAIKKEKVDSKTKGWGMNNSPFKERKSGLTWGGGNIHGANATRGRRRSMFDK